MAFREDDGDVHELLHDPFPRFVAIEAALGAVAAFRDPVQRGFAALSLIHTPDEPDALAESVHEVWARLGEAEHPMQLAGSLGLLLASHLVRHHDDLQAVEREWLRVANSLNPNWLGQPHAQVEIGFLALRTLNGGTPIAEQQIARVRAIYDILASHTWWDTGVEDIPPCVLLSVRPGTPTELGDRSRAIHRVLRREGSWLTYGWTRRSVTQDASLRLALADLAPIELLERFRAIRHAFAEAGYLLGPTEDIALLCFIARSAPALVANVAEVHRRMSEHEGWYPRVAGYAFRFAIDLVFMHLVGHDPELGVLADIKVFQDMWWISVNR